MEETTKRMRGDTLAAIGKRIADSRPGRGQVRTLISEGRSVLAEPDKERQERWIARLIQAPPETARRVVEGDRSALDAIVPEKRSAAEAIQGGTIDFVPALFLDLGRLAKRAVARVTDGAGAALGTGFLVSPRLFITNQHVLRDAKEAGEAIVEFNYEAIDGRRTRPVTRFALAPGTLFLASDEGILDYTLVAVGDRIDGGKQLESFGYCALSSRSDKHAQAIAVNIVQHPNGRMKELSLRENRITARDDRVLLYEADTLSGSSGSPVFNDLWEVIALHHYGNPSDPTIAAGTAAAVDDVNEGIRVSAIAEDLGRRAGEFGTAEADELIRQALALDPRPSLPTPESRLPRAIRSSDPELRRHTEENSMSRSLTPPVLAGRIQVPLEVFVRVAADASAFVPQTEAPRTASGTPEKIEIDRNYSNRRGYAPDFLGAEVALPKVKKAGIVAPLLNANGHGADGVLHYQHFSIVMSKIRRMAIFTAVNIDGERWINIDRDTGQPSEGAEASERWYPDDRIDERHQLEQDFFSATSYLFDRGHLVRRQDPTWGNDRKAVRANADTFHFTNCSPQNWLFNETVTYWQGVEQYLLEHGAVAEEERLTVFSGPVLDDADPDFDGVLVPLKYWKVVARRRGDKLSSTGFVVDQTEILREERRGREKAAPRNVVEKKAKEWLYSIAEIESMTGLDFGTLAAKDTFKGGPEGGVGAKRRLITGWSDIG